MELKSIEKHQVADDQIRHACSEIYLTVKHIRKENRMDDQEYQLILSKLRQIEKALIAIETESQ